MPVTSGMEQKANPAVASSTLDRCWAVQLSLLSETSLVNLQK